MDRLATLRAPVERLRRLVRETAVAPAPDSASYRVVRLSLAREGLEATTPTGGDGPTFAVRYDPGYLSSFDPRADRVLAALGTEATLRWLEWFDGGTVTARLLGDEGLVRAVELDDGSDTVEVGPLPSDVIDPDLSAGRPSSFEDGTFAPDGHPAPTRVETDGETLARLADAADIVGDDGLPVVVRDGEFRLAVVGEEMRGRGRLEAAVSGPDCENRYGPDLARIARVLSGPVELQIVPGGPLAVVQDHDDATRRYVLSQSV
ncbi:hypothetical protein [Halosimplex amylolyticum]|uniref:hypothetical protein n=1 Tax=Halosimplex amylolyticum TaxID=3396616 RepID=UPI003F553D70